MSLMFDLVSGKSHCYAPTSPVLLILGIAPPSETPQVSPRQAAAAKAATEAARLQPATGRGSGLGSTVSHSEVPMIRQVAAESSAPSSASEASIIRCRAQNGCNVLFSACSWTSRQMSGLLCIVSHSQVLMIHSMAAESSAPLSALEASVIRYTTPNSLPYNVTDSKTGVRI